VCVNNSNLYNEKIQYIADFMPCVNYTFGTKRIYESDLYIALQSVFDYIGKRVRNHYIGSTVDEFYDRLYVDRRHAVL
jgi:hypothetical protein